MTPSDAPNFDFNVFDVAVAFFYESRDADVDNGSARVS